MDDKLSRQARLHAQIVGHGENLNAIFHTKFENYELCKRLLRIENKGHRAAVDWCNGDITEEQFETLKYQTLRQADLVLNYTKQKIPVFFNSDARGYALKIQDSFAKDVKIYRDFGGYGIISPTFDGRE
jgi:hypothetical protein